MASADPSPLAPFPPNFAIDTECLRAECSHSNEVSVPATVVSQVNETRTVPGDPRVSLNPADVASFLEGELGTTVLDELYDWLWLFAKKSGSNIEPLHRHRVMGRQVIATEDPELHLVWRYDAIFVKALPACLLNHDFWTMYLTAPRGDAKQTDLPPKFDRRTALGFLRSYALLIRKPLDLALAKEAHLIPAHVEVDWPTWARFIVNFRDIQDHEASKRYHFGTLRLNRLNWAVRLIQPKSASSSWYYERRYRSALVYVKKSLGVLLFIFASMSLVLSSMQVALSVSADDLGWPSTDDIALQPLKRSFWTFAVTIVLLSGLIWVSLLAIPSVMLLDQLVYSIKQRRHTKIPTKVVDGLEDG